MPSDSENLEILVAKIQEQLAPDAEVLHNVKLKGRRSNRSRQIDVLVIQHIGQHEMRIVLECKDYARPVDVKGVEEFHGLLKDVGAHKGALVCPKGFTGAAKTRAAGLQIDLYSPVDTDPHKWQARVSIPTVCDFRSAAIGFSISISAPYPLTLPYDFWSSVVAYGPERQELGRPAETAFKKWNDGAYPTEPGIHEVPIFETEEVLIDNGHGMLVPVNLTASLAVKQQLYFGSLPVHQISGFKDELSNKVITNAFSIGLLDPEEIERSWQPIQSTADLPMPPALTLIGLIGYGTEGGD